MEGFRAGLIMIACGEATGGILRFTWQRPGQACPKAAAVPWHMVPRMLTWSRGRKPLPTLFSLKHTLRLTRTTPTRFVSLTMTHEAQPAQQLLWHVGSTDGGMTFTRVTNASGQSPFTNTFGDPVILYNRPTSTWFTVWLDANGSCTLGGYKSRTPADPNSWTHFLRSHQRGDDRESGWADNNPSSPPSGEMYVSWNDFNVGEGALQVTRFH